MTYIPVIGLEIHIQVKTKTKMFCGCMSDYFGSEPNINVCPVCIGLPGSLPVPNKEAIYKTVQLCMALNCSINKISKFDRKNYFYHDLPKGYQISQYDLPIGYDGHIEIEVDSDSRRIRIQRVHIEEDTAKSVYDSNNILLDFNKAGIPLIEVVTYPDFTSTEEVLAFAKRLRQILIYNQISDAEMQKGHVRFELNISLKHERIPLNKNGLPIYKVEVKNIGSISVLEKVIKYEIDRQSQEWNKGHDIRSQTRGIKDMSGRTFFQRYKEEAEDYRYFPEPDIPPFKIEDELINSIISSMPEQPIDRKHRYLKLGLESEQADVLIEDIQKGNWFDQALNVISSNLVVTPKELAKWIIQDISGFLEKKKLTFSNLPFNQEWLIDLLEAYYTHQITGNIVKKIIEEEILAYLRTKNYKTTLSPIEIIEKRGYKQVHDENLIYKIAESCVRDNPNLVASLQKNPNAIKALIGYGMKISRGKVNPVLLEKLLKKILQL
ncbi:MAG: Asp-tRNA(Asn)/Glu-tRNA(Gln) amidotransferase subunit GatB [Candidatus Dojkabacteria bacterium]|nr:Asp-tRNA(Asn)/Glu-tRNA(Gln) amidotransferase subunit GatB [Candidatus Dojkabacteria bacterium]